MGKVIYPRKGEVHTTPVTIPAVFADATWEQIIAACEANAVPSTWAVGDQKSMTIDGTDYPIDIIGKNHDTYSDGSGTAPLTFQMHNVYKSGSYMASSDNETGWSNSPMRKSELPKILALMPSEVQTAIRNVTKITSKGGMNATSTKSTSDKLFLLSEVEILGTTKYSLSGEGSQYEYYSSGNSAKKTTNDGTARNWWTRSPAPSGVVTWCQVTSSGAASSYTCYVSQSISFAFCF